MLFLRLFYSLFSILVYSRLFSSYSSFKVRVNKTSNGSRKEDGRALWFKNEMIPQITPELSLGRPLNVKKIFAFF